MTKNQELQKLQRLSDFLDRKYRGPFGFRFGWDALLGLIPGVGDIVTTLMSFFILSKAASLGCPPSVLFRMGANILWENFIDMIPFLGNIYDFFWKANTKNIDILTNYLQHPHSVQIKSRWFVVILLVVLSFLSFSFLAASVYLLKLLFD